MEKSINIKSGENAYINFDLTNFKNTLNEVVITGTLKEMSKLESHVPVEFYTTSFFKKNPTTSIYECLKI